MGGASLPGDPELSYKGSQANLEHGGGDKDLPKKKQVECDISCMGKDNRER